MPLYKNVSGQKIAVYAYDTSADGPKTGDAANITAQISKDGAATAATNDTNPTELDATDAKGIYIFDMLEAESNADMIVLSPVSSTSDIKIEPVIIYTTPGSNTGINSNVNEIGGDTQSATDLKDFADAGYDPATNKVQGVVLTDTCTTNTDMITVADILTTQMTEAYAADGTAPTLAQAIFLIQQSLHEFAIVDTTRTVKKLDGSTLAATFALDDATSPTSTTRAS